MVKGIPILKEDHEGVCKGYAGVLECKYIKSVFIYGVVTPLLR